MTSPCFLDEEARSQILQDQKLADYLTMGHSDLTMNRRPSYAQSHYLTKMPRQACQDYDLGGFLTHLSLNNGRVFRRQTRGFFQASGGKKKANGVEAKRSVAFRQLESVIGIFAEILTRGLVEAHQILTLIAWLRINAKRQIFPNLFVEAQSFYTVPALTGQKPIPE